MIWFGIIAFGWLSVGSIRAYLSEMRYLRIADYVLVIMFWPRFV